MRFEWDERKNERNIKKHKIDFRDVTRLWTTPIVVRVDDRQDYGETRWIALGVVDGIEVVVSFTKRQDRIRIISARRANRKERIIYSEKIRTD